LGISPVEEKFVEFIQYQNLELEQGEGVPYMAIHFQESFTLKVFSREVFQFLGTISEFGGLITFLRIFCTVCCMYFAEFFYNVSVASKIYMINKDIFKADYKFSGEQGEL
jgi:hypothetical protein